MNHATTDKQKTQVNSVTGVYNKDAVETYNANHQIDARQQNLIEFDYKDLPDADVVIGGPPCTQFSSAKSNKTRNVLNGLLLVQSFLRCVYVKQPKYWIMENVPTIQKYLPSEISLRSIGIDADGIFHIPTKVELVASDYGVPQKRRRYLIGNFPVPSPTHCDPDKNDIFTPDDAPWLTMGHVLAHLPDPLGKRQVGVVHDPNYDVSIPVDQLSDHFYDARFSEVEQRSIHLAKTQHPYMGKLAWPDRIDRPARTVVATQLGRETLVLQTKEGEYRRATVRECASFQSFPITYQFFGGTYGSKYRQAGDAVPPRLSFSLASAISEREGLSVGLPQIAPSVSRMANEIPESRLRRKRKPNFKRKANFLMPSKEVRGTRCELFVSGYRDHLVEVSGHRFYYPIWQADLVLGEGANRTQRYPLSDSISYGIRAAIFKDQRISKSIKPMLEDWDRLLASFLEGAEVYASYILEDYEKSPLKMVEVAMQIADTYLPTDQHHHTHVDCREFIDHPKADRLKVRVLAGCLMAKAATKAWEGSLEEASVLLSN